MDVTNRAELEEELQAALASAWEEWTRTNDPSSLDVDSLVELLKENCLETLQRIWTTGNRDLMAEFGEWTDEQVAAIAFMLFFQSWSRDVAQRWETRVRQWESQQAAPTGQKPKPLLPIVTDAAPAPEKPPQTWEEAKISIVADYDLAREAVTSITQAHSDAEHDAVRQVQSGGTILIGIWRTEPGACDECARLEGTRPSVWRAKAPNGPTLHPNCVLGETSVFVPHVVSVVRAHYDGPVVRIYLDGCRAFTVTPNHMFLTRVGFVRAADLVEGMHVVRAGGDQCWGSGGWFYDPNDYRKPVLAHQIFDSWAVSSCMASARVPVSSKHLHGDAAFVNGHIDVVRPDGKLRCELHSSLSKPLGNGLLVPTIDLAVDLSATSHIGELLRSLSGSSDGSMRRSRESQAFLLGQAAHAYLARGGSISDLETHLLESQIDGLTAYSERFAHAQNAFASMVTTSNVVRVEFDTVHNCPVYDFETESGLYIVEQGAVSSNCRCWLDWVAWEDS